MMLCGCPWTPKTFKTWWVSTHRKHIILGSHWSDCCFFAPPVAIADPSIASICFAAHIIMKIIKIHQQVWSPGSQICGHVKNIGPRFDTSKKSKRLGWWDPTLQIIQSLGIWNHYNLNEGHKRGWFHLLTMLPRARSQWGRDEIYPDRNNHAVMKPEARRCDQVW